MKNRKSVCFFTSPRSRGNHEPCLGNYFRPIRTHLTRAHEMRTRGKKNGSGRWSRRLVSRHIRKNNVKEQISFSFDCCPTMKTLLVGIKNKKIASRKFPFRFGVFVGLPPINHSIIILLNPVFFASVRRHQN